MNTKLKLVLIVFTAALLFSACSKEQFETKNIKEMHKNNGTPVKVETIKKGSFNAEYTYNAYLKGLKESNAYANIGDRIEKIFVKVGDYVKKDQVLAKFPTDNPGAQYYQAKLAYSHSKKTYERYEKLFETGGISKQDLESVKTQMDVNKENFKAVSKMVKVLSPIKGRVTKVNVRETDNVKKETLLFTVADLSKLKATVKVTESEISLIKKGLKATAIWNGNVITGKVVEVDFAMNMETQAFNATIEFDNKNQIVKAGVSADITIEIQGEKDSIITERKNIVNKNGKAFVFVAQGENAVLKEVKTGKTFGMYIEITEGLTENEKLITEGQFLLKDKTKIQIIK